MYTLLNSHGNMLYVDFIARLLEAPRQKSGYRICERE